MAKTDVVQQDLPGKLILIVGPSGVGKDTLLDGAASILKADGRFHLLRREITRPADAGGEDHLEVDEQQFHARAELGAYALWWGAHGNWYGVPKDMEEKLRAGRHVLVNASRTVIDTARARYANLAVIVIDVGDDELRRRLRRRGRETEAEIEGRLARARRVAVTGPDVTVFVNDLAPAASAQKFVDGLFALADAPPASFTGQE